MSIEAKHQYADIGGLLGITVPPILSGDSQPIGGHFSIPVYHVARRQVRVRETALRFSTLQQIATANRYMRSVIGAVYPEVVQLPSSDTYPYRLAAGNIFGFHPPRGAKTGHWDQFELEAVTAGNFPEVPDLAPDPRRDATPLAVALLLASARFRNGDASGRVGKVVRLSLPGHLGDNGELANVHKMPKIATYPVRLDDRHIAAGLRHIRHMGLDPRVRQSSHASSPATRDSD